MMTGKFTKAIGSSVLYVEREDFELIQIVLRGEKKPNQGLRTSVVGHSPNFHNFGEFSTALVKSKNSLNEIKRNKIV